MIEGCDRPAVTRQLCKRHYHRERRYGDPLSGTFRTFDSFEECWSHYVREDDHGLLWGGPLGGRDYKYGVMTARNERAYAHRYAWERAHGPIPEGMEVDHPPGCPKHCVTVEHFLIWTKAEHSRIGLARGEKPNFRRGGV